MPDDNKMYHLLFNKITDIIDELQKVQCEAEEMFIAAEEQCLELNSFKKCDDRFSTSNNPPSKIGE